jgi:hypothetical protein
MPEIVNADNTTIARDFIICYDYDTADIMCWVELLYSSPIRHMIGVFELGDAIFDYDMVGRIICLIAYGYDIKKRNMVDV